LIGMRTSERIIAINKDRNAPIMKIADVGIVGDLFEVIPALTESLREKLQKAEDNDSFSVHDGHSINCDHCLPKTSRVRSFIGNFNGEMKS